MVGEGKGWGAEGRGCRGVEGVVGERCGRGREGVGSRGEGM